MAQYNVKKLTFSSGDDSYSMSVADFIKTINGILPDEEGNLVIPLGTAASKSVADDLTVVTAGQSVLDAHQGKILNDKFASYIPTANIVDNLTTTAANRPLSATQGKNLKTSITSLENKVGTDVIGKINSTSGDAYYYKSTQFPGGLLMHFMRHQFKVSTTTASGGVYKASAISEITWPTAFSAIPAVTYSVQGTTGMWAVPLSAASKTNSGKIQVMSSTSASGKSVYINIIAIGPA